MAPPGDKPRGPRAIFAPLESKFQRRNAKPLTIQGPKTSSSNDKIGRGPRTAGARKETNATARKTTTDSKSSHSQNIFVRLNRSRHASSSGSSDEVQGKRKCLRDNQSDSPSSSGSSTHNVSARCPKEAAGDRVWTIAMDTEKIKTTGANKNRNMETDKNTQEGADKNRPMLPGVCRVSRASLVNLPTPLLLFIFRFFSSEELPKIAAAAASFWRLLLSGELLQRGSSVRLHSARRWVSGKRSEGRITADPSACSSTSSCSSGCSVVPLLLSRLPGRVSCLALSRRVLEPAPHAALLVALRSQSSSLKRLLISSDDFCLQGGTVSSWDHFIASAAAAAAASTAAAADGGTLLHNAFPHRLQQQQKQQKGSLVSSLETTDNLDDDNSLPLRDGGAVVTGACVLTGVTFSHLEELRVQGCQAFLWLRVLSNCSFPKCKVLHVACACIRQHAVPPPHGAAAAAADLLQLVRAMPSLQRLHLELALPPTRCFWRAFLFTARNPQQQRQQQQKQHQQSQSIQQLRINEGVFLNLAEVLEEAKHLGAPGTTGMVQKQQRAISEICVIAAQRRLHPAAMLRCLSAAGCTDTSTPVYTIKCEYVEVSVTPEILNSRALLQLLQHARHLRLVLTTSKDDAGQERRTESTAQQHNHDAPPALATEAAQAGLGQTPAWSSPPTWAHWQQEQEQQQQQQQRDAALGAMPAEARATAATAAQLFRVAAASRSIALDIREAPSSLVLLQHSRTLGGFQFCHCSLAQALENKNMEQREHSADLDDAESGFRTVTPNTVQPLDIAALDMDIGAPSVKIVGLPACARSCGLTLGVPSADACSSGAAECCPFCCCSSAAATAAAKAGGSNPSSSSNSAEGLKVCVCSILQLRVLPLLQLLPCFLLGHSGGGSSPWGADTTTALLQSDLLLLWQVCSNPLLRARCVGLEAEAAGQTPQQRRSFSRFLATAAALPERLRPPLRVLRLSLLSEEKGACCLPGKVGLSSRVLQLLRALLQHYLLLQQVEVAAPLYLRDPAEEPTAAKEPLLLLQLQELLQQHGFERSNISSSSAFRHVFCFANKAASPTA